MHIWGLSLAQRSEEHTSELGTGYEWWPNFYEFHKLAIDELNAFDYEKFRENGFEVKRMGDFPLKLMDK